MQALQGLKVLEVGNIIAGPFCGTLMADFGAEVIKVETPRTGDLIRTMGRLQDMWYAVEGRNKKNITLNLKSDKGKEILWELIRRSDVLIENFRPGVFARLGFAWEKIHEANPRIIYTCCSGYGQTGPKAHKPGFDRIGLALGGFLQVSGFPSQPPVKPGLSVADFYTAMFACIGTMFAIYSRDVIGTGQGQFIDCALTESILRLQESIIAEYSYDGTIRQRIGNGTFVTIPSGHFLTKDNQYLVLTVSGDKLFKKFTEAIERPDILEDPRFNTAAARSENRELCNQIAADWARAHTIDECLAALGDEVPSCKIYDVSDIMQEEQFKTRNDIINVSTVKYGVIAMQNVTPKLSSTPGKVNWAGAPLGAFNEEVLCKILGYTPQKFDELKNNNVI
ncbi:MAG: CoA transferase [Pyramidobacter porci]|uniref:CaiB/BaiF CoA transferase family protein n=1 Tax=Pyramidobacter porci TaxID=2605789 RepID=UPI002A747606|nr:CoA transferase [Pyramidobacter porci]MDY2649022.1 CoA transferase [Pyramidobacter porci]